MWLSACACSNHVPRILQSKNIKRSKMKSNLQLNMLVNELKEASSKNNANVWKRVASDLTKPTKKRCVVNLSKLEKYCNDNDTVIVPGKVLGMGDLTKKITVAAYNFSGSALEKIQGQGSKALTIMELLKKDPKGSNIKIIG
ncbi:MAG: 50S ribosomal protein L18e [archaeon]